jgi:hypothetical protein
VAIVWRGSVDSGIIESACCLDEVDFMARSISWPGAATACKRVLAFVCGIPLVALVLLDAWGYLTLGTLEPSGDSVRDPHANRVVMVFGATGSVGDGLLEAAMADPRVERIVVVARRTSPRIEAGVATGRVEMRLHADFTDYGALADVLPEVNTVLWGLGTSSLQVDGPTYTRIHVDFPVAFVKEWLTARRAAPMSFHYVTGMGTDPDSNTHWAREKGRAERTLADMAAGSGLRTFSYRSAFIRPSADHANALHYLGEALLRPGFMVIPAVELGRAMLEIGARTQELPNGTLIDNADSIAFARAWHMARN